jgi:hypothetical protein
MPKGRAAAALCAFAVYALARVGVAACVPWRRAFDDFFFLPETARWLAGGELGAGATFARVPVWHWMLGAHLAAFHRYGVLVLQAWIVLGAVLLYAVWLGGEPERAGRAQRARWIPLYLFLLCPQILLYSRQGVNELFIGLLTLGVMVLGERRGARAALGMGALVGLAACTKPAAGLLGVLALGYALRGGAPRAPALARLAAGFLLVAVPVLGITALERGWLVDNTTSFNLSGMSLEEWKALPDAATRQAVGMARFQEAFRADPVGYLAAALRRAGEWWLRPSSLDLGMFYKGYPLALVGAADAAAFAVLGLLALLGTRRRDAFVWLLAAGWTAACAFPLFTPRSPKLVLLYPMLLLAERGVVRASAWGAAASRAGGAGDPPEAGRADRMRPQAAEEDPP